MPTPPSHDSCYEFPSHLSSATIKAGILPMFVKLLSFRAPVGPRTKLPTATSCQLSDVGLSKRLLTWRSLILPSSASARRQLSTSRGENGQQLEVSIGVLLSNFYNQEGIPVDSPEEEPEHIPKKELFPIWRSMLGTILLPRSLC